MEDCEHNHRPENVKVGKYHFSSNFDSGNGWRFDQRDDEFIVYSIPDCEGADFATGYKTWYHFSVKGGVKGETISICVQGLNAQSKLYGRDMRPVVKSHPSEKTYSRVRTGVNYEQDEDKTRVRVHFKHRFEYDNEEVFFAFTYPYGYDQCQDMLAKLDSKLEHHPSIYYKRELLTESLEGKRLDLLTISSRMSNLEAAVAGSTLELEEPIEGLFPDGKPRPLRFGEKPVIFISARVHPGEVPAQWVFDGFLNFALKTDDPRAAALRENFVIKMVPMLNPDGVFRGCYRSDTLGQNLNRYYEDPDPALQPTIWAAKEMMMQLSRRGVLTNYIDLHAHATRRGCFLYGNAIPDVEKQIENVLYARLVALNTPHFDFDACNFTAFNMRAKDKRDGLSKEGSGRVCMFKETGLVHSYVLECNYNTGRTVNTVPNAATEDPRCSPGRHADKKGPPKYTPEIYGNVGKALAVAILDQKGLNPWSRLPNSHAQLLDNLRTWVTSHVATSNKTYRQEIKDKGLDTMSTARKKTVVKDDPPPPPKRRPMARSSSALRSVSASRGKGEPAPKPNPMPPPVVKSLEESDDSGDDSGAASDDDNLEEASKAKSKPKPAAQRALPQGGQRAVAPARDRPPPAGCVVLDAGPKDLNQEGKTRAREPESREERQRGGAVGDKSDRSVAAPEGSGFGRLSAPSYAESAGFVAKAPTRVLMTGKALDRARAVAERRQRQDLHNARRRVMYVADRSGDNNGPGLGGMVGRCMSVQQQPTGAAPPAAVSRDDLLRRGGNPSTQIGLAAVGIQEVRVAKPAVYQLYPATKMDARAPPRLKSSQASRRKKFGGAGQLGGPKLGGAAQAKEILSQFAMAHSEVSQGASRQPVHGLAPDRRSLWSGASGGE